MDTSTFEFLYGNEDQAHNIHSGAKLDWMEKDDRPPTVFKLLITAIIHEHAPILRYLLFMHPEEDLISKSVVQVIVDHPNLEIMELVCAHQPGIVNLGYGHTRTFLTEACQGGGTYKSPPSDKTLPLIHYLLDNGADPREGFWRDCVALHAALEFSRPLEMIDKMVKKGGTVDSLIFSEATMGRRIDALELFLRKRHSIARLTRCYIEH